MFGVRRVSGSGMTAKIAGTLSMAKTRSATSTSTRQRKTGVIPPSPAETAAPKGPGGRRDREHAAWLIPETQTAPLVAGPLHPFVAEP